MHCTPELVKNILMFTYHSSQTDRCDICNDFIQSEEKKIYDRPELSFCQQESSKKAFMINF